MPTSKHLSTAATLALGLVAIAAATSAEANPGYGRGAKGHYGYQSGAITKKERTIISRQRHRVNHLRRRAFQDGQLTRREGRKISKARRKLHHTIDWARRNDQVRQQPRFRDGWTDRTHDRRWHHAGPYPGWR